MSTKRILTIGEPLLRTASHPVKKFDARLSMILRDMAQTMYDAEGVGLAAPQIGLMRRIVVIDVGDGLVELINPEIIDSQGECAMVEGCLSVPGRRGYVIRPEKVKVRAQDKKGHFFELEGEGLLGRALQHEIDHLNGVLYVDLMEHEVFDEEEAEEVEA
ncbi:MAG: peptide deformylase [Clostridiales bacterium]|nr:peptide deformylase [Clostridiales bacterium]